MRQPPLAMRMTWVPAGLSLLNHGCQPAHFEVRLLRPLFSRLKSDGTRVFSGRKPLLSRPYRSRAESAAPHVRTRRTMPTITKKKTNKAAATKKAATKKAATKKAATKKAATKKAAPVVRAPKSPFREVQVKSLWKLLNDGFGPVLRSKSVPVELFPRNLNWESWSFTELVEGVRSLTLATVACENERASLTEARREATIRMSEIEETRRKQGLGRQIVIGLGRRAAGELTVTQQLQVLQQAKEEIDARMSMTMEIEWQLKEASRRLTGLHRKPAFVAWSRFPQHSFLEIQRFSDGRRAWTERLQREEVSNSLSGGGGVDLNALRKAVGKSTSSTR